MTNENLHEIYLKVSENLYTPTVDLEWLQEKLKLEDFLHLEELIENCLIASHEQLFSKGFGYAIDLTKGKEA